MKQPKKMLGARPNVAGGMSTKHHRKDIGMCAIRLRANEYLHRKGLLSQPSGYEATVPRGNGGNRIHG